MEVNLFSARVDLDTEKAKTGPLGVAGVELDDMCCESAFTIEGKYECKPENSAQTEEHFVTITEEEPGCYRWTNRKGNWWLCRETDNPKFLSLDSRCPHFNEATGATKIKVKKCKKTEVVEGFLTPWGERYEAVISYGNQQPLIEDIDKSPYECHRYDGTKMKSDWHFVTIESEGAGVYRWGNRAGMSWCIFETDDPLILSVSEECPYFKEGHRTVEIIPNDRGDGIRALLGPGGEKYDVEGQVTAKVARSPDPSTLPRKYRRNPNIGAKKDLTPADYIVIGKSPAYQKGVFMWSNSIGESWLIYTTKDPAKFKVGQECPYQAEGYRAMAVHYNKYGEVVSVEGPGGGLFEVEKCPPLKATFLTILPLKKYECLKYNNTSKKDDWHYVTIAPAGIDPVRPSLRRFLWQNRLGVEWFIYETQDPFIYEVDEKCCYYKEGHTKVHILIGKDGGIEALKGPWGDEYTAVDEFTTTGCVIA